MKYTDINNKSREELLTMLKDLNIKFGQFKFSHSQNTLKDTSNLDKTKRDIARVNTALNQLEK